MGWQCGHNPSDRPVQLSLQHRQVGHLTVVTCQGRLVAGAESEALLAQIDELLPQHRRILLHLGGVDYIDSGGLGLLVRCLTRVQNASGQLSLCALSPKVSDVLRTTKLDGPLSPYISEADAIALAHDATDEEVASDPLILCADPSFDVLAYLRGVLKEAGYRVVTTQNLYDGLILLKAMRPSVVVMGEGLRAIRGTSAADEFHRQVPQRRLVVLPPSFSSDDPAEARSKLLREIRAVFNAI
jgi:anti-sigma B factor antagonist